MNPEALYYYGGRETLVPGATIAGDAAGNCFCSPNLDAAIWAAELSDGSEDPRVYVVKPSGAIEDTAARSTSSALPHPSMTWRTQAPLVVVSEVETWNLYHGTKAQLAIGELITPGYVANFGPTKRTANFVYFTRTLDAAVWGAELATGDGPGRVYLVEPTGPIEDDPNLTNTRFRGNPSKSFRSPEPLRVVGEYTAWEGHSPELVRARKEALAKLDLAGVEPDDGPPRDKP